VTRENELRPTLINCFYRRRIFIDKGVFAAAAKGATGINRFSISLAWLSMLLQQQPLFVTCLSGGQNRFVVVGKA
jgi:hypothetical protein